MAVNSSWRQTSRPPPAVSGRLVRNKSVWREEVWRLSIPVYWWSGYRSRRSLSTTMDVCPPPRYRIVKGERRRGPRLIRVQSNRMEGRGCHWYVSFPRYRDSLRHLTLLSTPDLIRGKIFHRFLKVTDRQVSGEHRISSFPLYRCRGRGP